MFALCFNYDLKHVLLTHSVGLYDILILWAVFKRLYRNCHGYCLHSGKKEKVDFATMCGMNCCKLRKCVYCVSPGTDDSNPSAPMDAVRPDVTRSKWDHFVTQWESQNA